MIRVETRNTGTVVPKQTDFNGFFFRFIVPDSSDISADAIKSAAKAVGSINDAGCLPKSFFCVQIGSLFISSPPSPVYSSQLYLGKVALSAIGWNQKGSCINYD